ncbi:helix-turn-helix transcriptional regulator [Escherichia coli]|uniref:helix-turn-helix transcriptional regulator n=1 Tax=Escherichia coli TaxID=562 RepID=UPI00398832B5
MWLPLTDEQRLVILKAYGIECVTAAHDERPLQTTSISRTQAWKLEREGTFPPRKPTQTAPRAWLLSDLLCWIQTR